MKPVLRRARPGELPLMLGWAAAEGWNPGLEDAVPFRAADPAGFFVAEAEDAPAACISVVNHAPGHAFLGFYICRPALRGRGIGLALWTHALAHAGGRTVGLDGVADQEENYARSGFVRAGATRRLAGALGGVLGGAADEAADEAADPAIRDMAPEDFGRLAALDAKANGVERPAFLAAWLAPAETRRTVVGAGGFATIRRCREGCKIGPIVAPDAAAALRLARAAALRLPADIHFIDLPPGSEAFAECLEGQGFAQTFATARMYRGPAPVSGPMLQAIASMELG